MANQSNKQQVFGKIVFAAIVVSLAVLSSRPVIALDPLVDTGVSALAEDGKHVSVNIPAIFNMVLDTRGPSKGFRLEETVLSGLVKISMDRERGADGKLKGPIHVNVGGVPVYTNKQPPLAA